MTTQRVADTEAAIRAALLSWLPRAPDRTNEWTIETGASDIVLEEREATFVQRRLMAYDTSVDGGDRGSGQSTFPVLYAKQHHAAQLHLSFVRFSTDLQGVGLGRLLVNVLKYIATRENGAIVMTQCHLPMFATVDSHFGFDVQLRPNTIATDKYQLTLPTGALMPLGPHVPPKYLFPARMTAEKDPFTPEEWKTIDAANAVATLKYVDLVWAPPIAWALKRAETDDERSEFKFLNERLWQSPNTGSGAFFQWLSVSAAYLTANSGLVSFFGPDADISLDALVAELTLLGNLDTWAGTSQTMRAFVVRRTSQPNNTLSGAAKRRLLSRLLLYLTDMGRALSRAVFVARDVLQDAFIVFGGGSLATRISIDHAQSTRRQVPMLHRVFGRPWYVWIPQRKKRTVPLTAQLQLDWNADQRVPLDKDEEPLLQIIGHLHRPGAARPQQQGELVYLGLLRPRAVPAVEAPDNDNDSTTGDVDDLPTGWRDPRVLVVPPRQRIVIDDDDDEEEEEEVHAPPPPPPQRIVIDLVDSDDDDDDDDVDEDEILLRPNKRERAEQDGNASEPKRPRFEALCAHCGDSAPRFTDHARLFCNVTCQRVYYLS